MNSQKSAVLPDDIQSQRLRRAKKWRWARRGLLVFVGLTGLSCVFIFTWSWWYATSHNEFQRELGELGLVLTSTETAPGWVEENIPEWSEGVVGFSVLDAFQQPTSVQTTHLFYNEFRFLKRFDRDYPHVDGATLDGIVRRCPQLTALQLDRIAISNSGLQSIGALPELEVLSLQGTRIDGGFESLLALPQLRSVDISETDVDRRGLEQISRLQSLEDLRVSHTPLTGDDLSVLSNCQTLKGLEIDSLGSAASPITDPGRIPNTLEHLSMANTHVEPVSEIGAMLARNKTGFLELDLTNTGIGDAEFRGVVTGRLEVLSLSNSAITDRTLLRLKSAKALRKLELSGTQMTGEGLAALSGLKMLDTLSLGRLPIRNEHLAALPTTLRKLDLSDTDIDGNCLPVLRAISRIWHLDLSGTSVDDAFCAQLCQAPFADWLGRLDLSRTKVTRACLESLSALSNLSILNLNGIELGGSPETLAVFQKFPSLDSLSLEGCGIGDAELQTITRSPMLSNLLLANNEITDEGIQALNFAKYRAANFDLTGNPTTDASLEALTATYFSNVLNTQVTRQGLLSLPNGYHIGQWEPRPFVNFNNVWGKCPRSSALARVQQGSKAVRSPESV